MYNINIGQQGKIMRRLLGKLPTESPHDANNLSSSSTPAAATAPTTGISSPPIPVFQYRPGASQNAVYAAGVPISCIDTSPDGSSAILAGPHILRTVNFVDDVTIKEGVDLRALISAQPASRGDAPSSIADQRSIKDVKWGTGRGNATIFTACATGKIFQYDLSRVGGDGAAVEFIQIRADSRQVNTLDINPHRGTYLLSGSQDGIVRCFDIRLPIHTRTGLTFQAVQAFKCNADAVRHVQWSPKDGFLFACGTEQGAVLKWDIRKSSAPLLRINAHERTCSSISWHPDGDHLVSAGLDSKCNVWDMSKTADKRQKPKWTISTPAPVSSVSWRPGQWSATAQAKRASQIAVSYDESSPRRFGINAVHIWDLARPTMPYKEIQRFDSSPSAILWHDQYTLWTAGYDGLFNQCDVTFAPKVIDRQAVSTMSFSSRGDVLMFLDERAPSHRPRPHIIHPDVISLPSYTSTPVTTRFTANRSDSEDDVVGSFLGPKQRGGRKRRPSTRSTTALSTTPPTGSGIDEVLSLEQTIKVTGVYRPQQAMAIGHVPSSAKVDVYEYLSVNYLETLYRELPYVAGGNAMPERVAAIMEHYAKAAEYVNQFRLAQTWRILAYGIDLVLRRRGEYHLQFRMDRLRGSFSIKNKTDDRAPGARHPFELSIQMPLDGERTPRKVMSSMSLDKAGHPRSLLSEELESTSNVPTPIARPISDHSEVSHAHGSGRGKKLTPILEPESFMLPPAIGSHSSEIRKRLDSVPMSTASHDSDMTQASTEGYDFYDTEAISKAIDVPLPRPASTQSGFEPLGSPDRIRKPPVMRHDSDESFAQIFSLSDGSRRTTGLTNTSNGSVPKTASALAGFQRTTSGSDEGDFGSRVRGKHLAQSPARMNGSPFRMPLGRTDTNITAYTDEHHVITQTTSGSFDSPYPSQTDADFSVESPLPLRSSGFYSPDDDMRSPFVMETDYLCWPNDPPYPHPVQGSPSFSTTTSPPLQPYSLISRALAFEAKSSALNASAIILLLKPLIPEDVIDFFQATAILRQHHSRLMSMKLFVEATLLRKLCMRGWPGGVLSSWGDNYPTIFTPAQQGVQAGFMCSKCRKPRDIDRTAASTESIWHCERCKAVMAPCAICGHRDTTPNLPPTPLAVALGGFVSKPSKFEEEPVLSTWWYCPGCGHGGHSSCIQGWHSAFESELHDYATSDYLDSLETSDGCCPLDGCGHACLPGRWRAESAAARTEEVSRAVREATHRATKAAGAEILAAAGGSDRHHPFDNVHHGHNGEAGVRSDGHDVSQSRAVESVREALAVGPGERSGYSTPRVSSSILSSSPGRGGERVERERRKSVKFAAPDRM